MKKQNFARAIWSRAALWEHKTTGETDEAELEAEKLRYEHERRVEAEVENLRQSAVQIFSRSDRLWII